VICADVLVNYKQEVNGSLKFSDSGIDNRVCSSGD